MKLGKSVKPAAIQAAVILKSLNGDNITKIADDMRMSRNTVYNILGDAELLKLVNAGKSGLHELIPASIKAFAHHIDKHSIPEATTVLRATGVLPQEQVDSGGPAVNVNLGVFGDRE